MSVWLDLIESNSTWAAHDDSLENRKQTNFKSFLEFRLFTLIWGAKILQPDLPTPHQHTWTPYIFDIAINLKRMGHQWWTCQFWCSLTNAGRAAWCWAVSTGPTRRWAFMPPSGSLLVMAWSESCTRVSRWRSFWFCNACSSCSSSHKGADSSPAAGTRPLCVHVQLSSCCDPSPGISSTLLRLLWDSKPSSDGQYGEAGLPVQPEWAAGTASCYQQWKWHWWNAKLDKNQLGRIRREMICGHHLQSNSIFEGCLAVASPVHLLSFSSAEQQLKWIHNHSRFLTGQINIPEVWLIFFYITLQAVFLLRPNDVAESKLFFHTKLEKLSLDFPSWEVKKKAKPEEHWYISFVCRSLQQHNKLQHLFLILLLYLQHVYQCAAVFLCLCVSSVFWVSLHSRHQDDVLHISCSWVNNCTKGILKQPPCFSRKLADWERVRAPWKHHCSVFLNEIINKSFYGLPS